MCENCISIESILKMYLRCYFAVSWANHLLILYYLYYILCAIMALGDTRSRIKTLLTNFVLNIEHFCLDV